MAHIAKKSRVEDYNKSSTARTEETSDTVDSIVIKLESREGTTVGPAISVPTGTTRSQLELLLAEFTKNPEADTHAFYVNEEEVSNSLASIVESQHVSTEQTVRVIYQPVANFRVSPVTRCTATLPGHTGAILHVAFSPNGAYLASGGGDNQVRFWDTYTATPKFVCKGHKSHVLCTAIAPDGKLFASGDKEGVIRIWSPLNGKEVCPPLKGHRRWITGLAWEPLHANSPCNRLASSSRDGSVRIWNTNTGSFLFSLSGHTDSVEAIRWSGENIIYTASRDRTIKVWSLEDGNRGKLIRTLEGHAHRVNALALSTDYVLRCGGYDPSKNYLPTTDEELSANAKKLYNAHKKRGSELLVSCSDDCTLILWDPLNSKRPVTRLTGHQQPVNHISFSPDARLVASASFDKKIRLWSMPSGKLLTTLHGHVGPVYQVCWSSDSRYLASASKDSTAKVWRADVSSKGKALYTLPGHADEVFALDWSPCGSKLATGSRDRTLKIWAH